MGSNPIPSANSAREGSLRIPFNRLVILATLAVAAVAMAMLATNWRASQPPTLVSALPPPVSPVPSRDLTTQSVPAVAEPAHGLVTIRLLDHAIAP